MTLLGHSYVVFATNSSSVRADPQPSKKERVDLALFDLQLFVTQIFANSKAISSLRRKMVELRKRKEAPSASKKPAKKKPGLKGEKRPGELEESLDQADNTMGAIKVSDTTTSMARRSRQKRVYVGTKHPPQSFLTVVVGNLTSLASPKKFA